MNCLWTAGIQRSKGIIADWLIKLSLSIVGKGIRPVVLALYLRVNRSKVLDGLGGFTPVSRVMDGSIGLNFYNSTPEEISGVHKTGQARRWLIRGLVDWLIRCLRPALNALPITPHVRPWPQASFH